MAEKAKTLFSHIKGIVTRDGLGEVVIDDRSAKDDLSHGVGPAKAAVIPTIPEVIRKGRQIDAQENWKGRAYNGYIFAAPVTMDEETVCVAAVVKQSSKNRFYLHEVVDSRGNVIKMSNGDGATQTSLAADGDAGTLSPLPDTSIPQSQPAVNPEETGGAVGVGAAEAGFQVPGGPSREVRTSRYAESMGYNADQAEAKNEGDRRVGAF